MRRTIAPQPTASPAEAYQGYAGPAVFEPLASLVLSHARPRAGESVLDVACGTGIVTRAAARLVGPDARVVGVDVDAGMLDVARAVGADAGPAIEWRHGDATALDLPDATFDLVLCQQGLQFLPDRAAGVRQMRRVLRDGGRATLAVWQGLDRHPLFDALADAEVPHLARFGLPVTRDDAIAPFSLGDPDELTALLAGTGFGDVEVVPESIVARFPDADRFVERMEFAYAAVVPAFVEDPAAFAAYLDAIERDTRAIVELYRDGDHVVVPMHANVAIAHA